MSEQENLLTPDYRQPANLPNATAALVLGILSIVGAFCYGLGIIFGIIGLVLATKDRGLYNSSPGVYSSSSFSTSNSGRICSIIGLVLSALMILVMIIFGAYFYQAFKEGGGKL